MQKPIYNTLAWIVCLAFCGLGVSCSKKETTDSTKQHSFEFNVGYVCEDLQKTKEFYLKLLDFEIAFENEFYVLMQSKEIPSQKISFLEKNHPTQNKIFQAKYSGKGSYLTVEVPSLQKIYDKAKNLNLQIAFPPKQEVWGDYHFAVVDPNGLGIDFVEFRGKQP